ncbi:MAG: NTP transferase domain-containing protein [Deltaproteobacteria bacterium]|nr:NTP transferase domain-containing protein [Deltaproteobacteria bacterium]
MINLPNMLMIGAAARNVGKTELACAVIARHHSAADIVAIKIAIADDEGESTSSATGRGWRRETAPPPGKDTGRLHRAGAAQVYRLVTGRGRLEGEFRDLLDHLGDGKAIVCESNSLRRHVVPGLFLLVRRENSDLCKPSAAEVMKFADRVVLFDGQSQDIDTSEIRWADSKWVWPMDANAVILAGGQSTRMGRDKSLLEVAGEPLIKRLFGQLLGTFQQILISTGDGHRYGFLDNCRSVVDEVRGCGPVAGILAALENSDRDVNFIVACDIPEIPLYLVRQMIAAAPGWDCVVPVSPSGRIEPLFGVYRKNMIPPLRAALASGQRRVRDVVSRTRTHFFKLDPATVLKNINTPDEYQRYIREQRHDPI